MGQPMRLAVDLDHEPRLSAVEVYDEAIIVLCSLHHGGRPSILAALGF